MVSELDTPSLQRLLREEQVQLVEVLPPEDYEQEHLPHARNMPLGELDDTDELDASRPVVIYAFDRQDDRAHRAAVRLEASGFSNVMVYAPGKAAWLAEALPSEGLRTREQRVVAIARREGAPTLRGDATLADAATAFAEHVGPSDVAVVLDARDVVLGVVRKETLGLAPSTPVADVLQPGPSTFRPSMTIAELVEYFRSSEETRAIVSTPGGRWLGIIHRRDVLDD